MPLITTTPYKFIEPPGSWDTTTISLSHVFNVNEEAGPNAMAFGNDGTKMYVAGDQNHIVYEYDLSTGWDLSTAAYNSSNFDVGTQTSGPTGVDFKPDGTKMYISNQSGSTSVIHEYDLSVAWDVSSASFLQTYSWIQSQTVQDLRFKPDGLSVFTVHRSASDQTLTHNGLSSAWDISSISLGSRTTQNLGTAVDDGFRGLYIRPTGETLFLVGNQFNAVYEYSLSIAWDVTTATYTGTSTVLPGIVNIPSAISFKTDGGKMYVLDNLADEVLEYTLS